MENYKIVAVGDGATGKTSLLQTFALNKFPELYEPTIFDNYSATIMYNENIITLNLWDLAVDYKPLKTLKRLKDNIRCI
jgi:small GTP-binding protein